MKLTLRKRKALPDSAFAGPGRSFPVEDKGHAVAAKGRATQALDAGRMSEASADKIKAKADRVISARRKKS